MVLRTLVASDTGNFFMSARLVALSKICVTGHAARILAICSPGATA